MGNLELAWIMNNVKDYNLEKAVDLMQQIDWRLSVAKQEVEECNAMDVVKMLDLLGRQNNLEIAYDIVGEHVDKLLDEQLDVMYMLVKEFI